MDTNDPNDNQLLEMQIIEYRLGLMTPQARARFADRLRQDRDLRARYDQIAGTVDVLDEYKVLVPNDLQETIIAATRAVAPIDAAVHHTKPSGRRGDRLAIFSGLKELLAAAAAILIVVSTWMATARSVRHQSLKALCASQLNIAGTGIARYANDYPDQLPVAKVAPHVGWYDRRAARPRRHHLFILVKKGYIDPETLLCPASGAVKPKPVKNLDQLDDFTAAMSVTYSFQNLYGEHRFTLRQRRQRWDRASQMAIMADRTPLLKNNKLVHVLKPFSQSPNHHSLMGGGQNILFLDGSVVWQWAPVVGGDGDNIWQAGTVSRYTGRELSVGPTDAFLVP